MVIFNSQLVEKVLLARSQTYKALKPTDPVPFRRIVKFRCTDCSEPKDDLTIPLQDEAGSPLYECLQGCGKFNKDNSANSNHQCPICSKFGTKVKEFTGLSCLVCKIGELEEVIFLECQICQEKLQTEGAEGIEVSLELDTSLYIISEQNWQTHRETVHADLIKSILILDQLPGIESEEIENKIENDTKDSTENDTKVSFTEPWEVPEQKESKTEKIEKTVSVVDPFGD